MGETTRLDVWLWSVRVFKSRALSKAACVKGNVRVNGKPAKSSTQVVVGDRIELRVAGRERVLEVLLPLKKRVGAKLVADAMLDLSPPAPVETTLPIAATPRRDPGTGRPTKRERRQLDRWRDQNR